MVAKDAQVEAPTSSNIPAAERDIPLCVDLDGTVIKSDCLWETVARALFQNPGALVMIALGAWRGLPWLKRQMSASASFSAETLPYNSEVIAVIEREKAAGRPVILISASDQGMVDRVGAHLRLFDEVIGSDGKTNLRGAAKAAFLVRRFGRGGFDYMGDSRRDIPVWESARRAIAVNPSAPAQAWVSKQSSATIIGRTPGTWRPLTRALRPQHWPKNVLVFLPLLTAHLWHEPEIWKRLTAFFFALCFGASGVYLINDLADIESDRRHKDKLRRPIASGALPIADALAGIPLCLGLALYFCSLQGWEALWLLAGYIVATCAYSFWLKRVPVLDILFLSGFYVFRIVAGAVLAPVALSEWLIAFAMFLFLSLAAAKRYVELATLSTSSPANQSRGYVRDDYPMIATFGVNCACLAVLVLGLYINSETFQRLYSRAWIFWLLCPLLLYWLIRVWILAGRHKLDEDPVVFAIKDKTTWIIAALGALVFFAAIDGRLG